MLNPGRDREIAVVLDEYPYLLEHTPQLDSIIQRALGPRNRRRTASRVRLVLRGSAMTVMRRMPSGTAPLHGRAGLDLRISPFDFRGARELHGLSDLRTALRTFAVIGGVAPYGREMGGDLPAGIADFDRRVCRRVLSPAAPLFNQVDLLLSEDPSTARARKDSGRLTDADPRRAHVGRAHRATPGPDSRESADVPSGRSAFTTP